MSLLCILLRVMSWTGGLVPFQDWLVGLNLSCGCSHVCLLDLCCKSVKCSIQRIINSCLLGSGKPSTQACCSLASPSRSHMIFGVSLVQSGCWLIIDLGYHCFCCMYSLFGNGVGSSYSMRLSPQAKVKNKGVRFSAL